MKIYLGVFSIDIKTDFYNFHDRILLSYYRLRTPESYRSIKEHLKKFNDVFLDSGAFSAFTQKTKVSLMDYVKFIMDHKEFKTYAALDFIYDSKATRKNFEEMKGYGLNPIPTFHHGSDIEELKYYSQYPYIGLGGLVPFAKTPEKLKQWLDYCFSFLIKRIKDEGLKVHGFGITNMEVLRRYPFYSVDSTSWTIGRKFGAMYEHGLLKLKEDPSQLVKYLKTGGTGSEQEQIMSQKNIELFRDLEKTLTHLWETRGIKFND